MIYIIKFIYQTFLLPPGIFIIVILLLGIFLYKKQSGISKALIAISLIIYLMSIPLVGDNLINSLEGKYTPPADIKGDVIVMLGGGATADTSNVSGQGHLSGYSANRLLTCAQLYRILNVPIIISGGKVYGKTGSDAEIGSDILKGLGIPDHMIIAENKSLNTSQNSEFTKEIIDKMGFKQPVLVTSAFHMDRSVRQFEKVHLTVTPYPSDYQTNAKYRFHINDIAPNAGAALEVNLALKEYIGILASKWY